MSNKFKRYEIIVTLTMNGSKQNCVKVHKQLCDKIHDSVRETVHYVGNSFVYYDYSILGNKLKDKQ